MTSFSLRVLAMTAMLLDHLGIVLLARTSFEAAGFLLRAIGRASFPLFAFLIINGCTHTRSRRAYLGRLLLLALLSQIPYSLFSSCFVSPAVPVEGIGLFFLPAGEWVKRGFLAASCLWCWRRYYWKGTNDCSWRLFLGALALLLCPVGVQWKGFQISTLQVNIFYQLALGVYLYSSIRRIQRGEASLPILLPAAAALFLLPEGYGPAGILLSAMLTFFPGSPREQAGSIFLWNLFYHLSLFSQLGPLVFLYLLGGLAAALAVLCYSQKARPSLGRVFYGIYPLHLLLYTVFGCYLFP